MGEGLVGYVHWGEAEVDYPIFACVRRWWDATCYSGKVGSGYVLSGSSRFKGVLIG